MTDQRDVIIIGAGFAGLYALHKIRKLGLNVIVVEAADDIGGTWHWNSYPGARCDVESFQYSYSFDDDLQQEWEWSERYASQPEILDYLKHVAGRYDLARDIRLNTRVESAVFDEDSGQWQVHTDQGIIQARFLISAVGCLSKPNMPNIPGLDNFQGQWVHTGQWSEEGIDLRGKKVGVIGTGSSGVQVIAEIAPEVDKLTVFQRTPHWVARAGNYRLSEFEKQETKANYARMRDFMKNSLLGMNVAPGDRSALDVEEAERRQIYEAAWDVGGPALLMSFSDLLVSPESNRTCSDFVADKIREIVDDPDTAEALIPDPDKYPVGGRRMVQDDRYYATYNRDNVALVNALEEPIESITAHGIQTAAHDYDLDVIIFATGFDAVTGTLLNLDIRGRNNTSLKEKWQDGAVSYLGVAVESFPNLFIVTGPGSPSVLSNMVLSIEQHVDWITDAIGWMQTEGKVIMEAAPDAEAHWVEHVVEAARPTVLFNTTSWYHGANVDGKPKVFLPYLGGVGSYREECNRVAREGYAGFKLL